MDGKVAANHDRGQRGSDVTSRAEDERTKLSLSEVKTIGGGLTVKFSSKTVHEEITPSVIEPWFGVGRILYSFLEHSFRSREGDEQRSYFSLTPVMAPLKCSVLPLSNNADFTPFRKISSSLTSVDISHKVDDLSGSIGRLTKQWNSKPSSWFRVIHGRRCFRLNRTTTVTSVAGEPVKYAEIRHEGIYAASCENCFYWVVVLGKTVPSKILRKVHLIDYGNELVIPSTELRPPLLLMKTLEKSARVSDEDRQVEPSARGQ
ncbi:uncharacterized protein LOC119770621 [Culex quinquefasciatus]|uniref:uncharacterized protein LOC119770621 n=1 Tax=Culex quinquefasciatus TaxID=7176 RepID=UPI0018E2F5F4|nr:uncharacterized protein LOC119770621 [Culex quinquefasciatus]